MHSLSEPLDLTCARCGRALAFEAWLIVDAGERPDLLARARAGDLHTVTCPVCGPQGAIDAPLLLYLPDHNPATGQPPLLFSPAQQTSAEQDQQMAAGLLRELAGRLGDAWQDDWLAQVASVRRELLPVALSDDPAAAMRAAIAREAEQATGRQGAGETEDADLPPAVAAALMEIAATLAAEGVRVASPDDLERALAARPDLAARLEMAMRAAMMEFDDDDADDDLPGSSEASGKVDNDSDSAKTLPDLLNRFIAADSWDASQRIVEAHPELLDEATDWLLGQLVAAAKVENDADSVRTFEIHRALLRRCRAAGIARAFAEQMLPPEGLAEAERLGLTPEAFLAQLRAAQQMPPTLREVLAALAAEGVEIHSQEELEQALASRPDLRAKLEAAVAAGDGPSVPPEFADDLRRAQDGEQRYLRSGDLAALDAAAAAWTRILDAPGFATVDARFRLAALNDAGGVFLRRYWAHGRVEDLNRALAGWEQAVKLTPPDSPDRPSLLNNLGTGLSSRYARTGRLEDLEAAIGVYEQAVKLTPPDSPDRPGSLNNLGTGLSDRYARTGRLEDLEAAIRDYRAACELGAALAPEDVLRAARNWGRWALERQSWGEAAEAWLHGLTTGRALHRRQLRRTDKESWLGEMQTMAPAAAYALARLGESLLAVQTLELGRAQLLGEALEQNRRDLELLPARGHADLYARYQAVLAARRRLEDPAATAPGDRLAAITAVDRDFDAVIAAIRTVPGYEDFYADPTFDQIQAAAHDGPLVYLLATAAGGLALIVYGAKTATSADCAEDAERAVEAVWLEGFTEARLREWLVGPADDPALGGWLGAYQAWLNDRTAAVRNHWHTVIDVTLRVLWDAALAPIAAALAHHTIAQSPNLQSPIFQSPISPSPITLIPTGLLALLPLHAAWTDDAAALPDALCRGRRAAASRTYFLDCFDVAYAPSATARRHAQTVVAQMATAAALLAIDEPAVTGAGRLPNSAAEVTAIADLFAAPQVLRREAATRNAVLAALPGVAVAHFSCHGNTDWQDALQSGLLLTGGARLTVGDLLDRRLPGARLITLSACETGIVGTKLPDETVALPAALTQAGFAGVVASLWSVYDISTAMLMVRFYELWRTEGLAPPAALAAAQRWVRDTTNTEKAAHFGRDFLPGGAKMSAAVAEPFFEAVFQAGAGDDRAFEHPVWWAAFTYTGV